MLLLFAACTSPAPSDMDSTSDLGAETGAELLGGDLFDNTGVHRIDLTLSAEDAQAMRDDLDERIGEFGSQPDAGGPPGGGGGGPPPGGGGGGGPSTELYDGDPIWVQASLSYDGEVWDHVGMRFKGNSSLTQSWLGGSNKLPFRLNLDKYEDDFPDTKNQRIQDHDKLTFSSGFKDDTQLREAYTAEMFGAHGLPVAQWSFVEVWVDVGEGPAYWGLYTMLEDPSDDVWLERHFGTSDMNVYKPESTFEDFDEDDFEKKTNEDEADFSDVSAAVEALHGGDVAEHVDVPAFVSWLAINTAIENWDVYGALPHNYYLVADPESGLLVWVPWDHNMSMNSAFEPSPGIWHEGTTDEWPLITTLIDDPEWAEVYADEVARAMDEAAALDTAEARLTELHDQIAVSVGAEVEGYRTVSSDAAFEAGVQTLLTHLEGRHDVVAQDL